MDPVRQVPTYYESIAQPMDLQTMSRKLDSGLYPDARSFRKDFMLIVNNCREFNLKDSTYCRCADALEGKFNEMVVKLRLEPPMPSMIRSRRRE